MAFIVKKKIKGHDYFYLQESKREGDKVKSISLGYLGKTREEAEEKMKEILEKKKEVKIEIKETKKVKKDSVSNVISVEELANFCKTKGFVFRSSDVYGGFAGFWDFGPLGVELFNNIKREWWNQFVTRRDDVVGMEASVISHPRVWKASGHLDNFNDFFVKCKKCGKASKVDENEIENNKVKLKCDNCGGEYEVIGKFNLMFSTSVGAEKPVEAYLRGETAQGMFIDFKLIQQTSRQQIPFGIAQIGRCFRNEISPRDFLFRSREFHIGEFEFFINPDEKKCKLLDEEHLSVRFKFLDEETQNKRSDELKEFSIKDLVVKKRVDEWQAYWLAEQILFFEKIGFDVLRNLKVREHTKNELSHYSSATFDIDFMFSFGSREIAGNANRGTYDLTQHMEESKNSFEIYDEETKKKIIPRVIEPTFGMERIFLAILSNAYNYDKERDYVVLKLPPKLAPIKAAVFPIVKQEKFEKISEDIVKDLKKEFNVVYDKGGSIGRRYARNDEIGTPFCITVDEDSLKNKDVTIRYRDTTKQVRVKISELRNVFRELINGERFFDEIGREIKTRKK